MIIFADNRDLAFSVAVVISLLNLPHFVKDHMGADIARVHPGQVADKVSVLYERECDVRVFTVVRIRPVGAETHDVPVIQRHCAVGLQQKVFLHPQPVGAESVCVSVLFEDGLVYGDIPSVQIARFPLVPVMNPVIVALYGGVCHF